ncbi:MAG: hypothetical protein KJN79_03510, partial [Gammaproteobacteria bacterium]|nr:hypothetical protein [Gammaproteobacteria bacterium]
MSTRQPKLKKAEIGTNNHRSEFGQECCGKRKTAFAKSADPAKGPSEVSAHAISALPPMQRRTAPACRLWLI